MNEVTQAPIEVQEGSVDLTNASPVVLVDENGVAVVTPTEGTQENDNQETDEVRADSEATESPEVSTEAS